MTNTAAPVLAHINNPATIARYVSTLAEAVAIPSVSCARKHRPDCLRMQEWMVAKLKAVGAHVETRDVGTQELEGATLPLPPVVLAQYPATPVQGKKNVLVYGHLDVQPALKSDGWATEPFTLTEKDGKLFGRGSTDDKGPVLGWLFAIEAHQATNTEFPVNLFMCFEGMEESGSEGLDDLIVREADKFFKDVDCVCISDNYWISTKKPCITYGLRGISYYAVEIRGPGKDLHSGTFGGTVHEPVVDLFHLFSKIVAPDGRILIPGALDDVAPLTDAEKKLYETIEFKISDIHESIASKNTIHDDAKDALLARWRYPSLSIHGIEGAFSEPGAKTVIPARAVGKFSIRTVPNMNPQKVTKQVKAFLEAEFAKLGSKNTLSVSCGHEGRPWVADISHWNYTAAIEATKKVWGVTPDMTREGGSIPVTLTFQEALKKSVLLLPMGRSDDGAHSTNEKLDKENLVKGVALLSTYLHEVASA